MTRRLAPVALLLALVGCGAEPPLPSEGLSIRVEVAASPVEPGRPFPLTVVRTWPKEVVPSIWSDRALAPLVVRLEDAEVREGPRSTEERRRYRAWAVSRLDVVVRPIELAARPKDGGAEVRTSSEAVRVPVAPALDAAAPGPPELPGDLPRSRFPWLAVLGGLALAAAALVVALRRREGAPGTTVPAPVTGTEPPETLARAALRRIRERASREPDRVAADLVETAEVVRVFVAARFGVATRERTTEEVLGHPWGPHERGLLSRALGAADLVKFAHAAPGPAELAQALGAADSFVGSAS